MVIISCSGKFHAFALAEQMHKYQSLSAFYTSYAYQKNNLFRKLAKRIDKEQIPGSLIHTNLLIAFGIKCIQNRDFLWNDLFDQWVSKQISRRDDYKIFIGWGSMSLHSIRVAKENGQITILERGSSHILYQNKLLQEEYKLRGKVFSINPKVIEKELKEYEICDYISIPSSFVRDSFLQFGVPAFKLIQNPYGVSAYFKKGKIERAEKKFTILYLGTLSVRKGLFYLFDALQNLDIPSNEYEVHFIGTVHAEIQSFIYRYQQPNWKFIGHINHYDLPEYLAQCDIAVHPSLEEGLSMVILQLLASGIPVIATTNTGGADIIQENETGFIVPIGAPLIIAEKLLWLFRHPVELQLMKRKAAASVEKRFTWDAYGNRYLENIHSIINKIK